MKGELNFPPVKYCAAAGTRDVCRPYISVIRGGDKDASGEEVLHAAEKTAVEYS